jgi:hypothetical protein
LSTDSGKNCILFSQNILKLPLLSFDVLNLSLEHTKFLLLQSIAQLAVLGHAGMGFLDSLWFLKRDAFFLKNTVIDAFISA